jgi:4-diphosphocytidyl-2-C-methyl-D-erythritol kinase
MRRLPAPAKINLAHIVGPRRPDGKHEVTTVLQRVDLGDRIALEHGVGLQVNGFADDTLVTRALSLLAAASGIAPSWTVRISKRIPVASGLGGGSSDAATALRLANEVLPTPLTADRLAELAAEVGADVPFFLVSGPQLGESDGSRLTPVALPQDFWVVLVLPEEVRKHSTAAVYEEFDRRVGEQGYERRRVELLASLARVRRPRDLAELPANDLADSPLADELRRAGAFRADVSGAGPAVYGLFHHRSTAAAARRRIGSLGPTWLTVPTWYG